MAVVTPLTDLEVASNMVLNLQNRIMEVSALPAFQHAEVTIDGTTVKGDKAAVIGALRVELSRWRAEYHRIQRAADIAAGLSPGNPNKILVRFL